MKRNEIIFLCLTGALAGCRTAPPTTPPPMPLPVVPAIDAPSGLRIPEVIRSYAVGAYIDPDDPLVRHEAHRVYRVETPARWDLRPPSRTPVIEAPAATPIMAAMPAKTAALPMPAEFVAPVIALEPALTPNADGLIDLTANETGDKDDSGNPFVVRRGGTAPAREITLHLAGVVGGPRPCALINERLVQAGEGVETLTVVRIEDQSVLLRHGGQLLRLPVADLPIRVRLPL